MNLFLIILEQMKRQSGPFEEIDLQGWFTLYIQFPHVSVYSTPNKILSM